MSIHNEIFETYRIQQKEINNAIKLLKEKGYSIYKKNENTINQK